MNKTIETKRKRGRPFDAEPNESLTFRLPASLVARLDGLALEHGRAKTAIAREAILLGLEDMETAPERVRAVRLALAGRIKGL